METDPVEEFVDAQIETSGVKAFAKNTVEKVAYLLKENDYLKELVTSYKKQAEAYEKLYLILEPEDLMPFTKRRRTEGSEEAFKERSNEEG